MSDDYNDSDDEDLDIKGFCMPLTHGGCKKMRMSKIEKLEDHYRKTEVDGKVSVDIMIMIIFCYTISSF